MFTTAIIWNRNRRLCTQKKHLFTFNPVVRLITTELYKGLRYSKDSVSTSGVTDHPIRQTYGHDWWKCDNYSKRVVLSRHLSWDTEKKMKRHDPDILEEQTNRKLWSISHLIWLFQGEAFSRTHRKSLKQCDSQRKRLKVNTAVSRF